jgi:hypothetical protein
MAGRTAAVSVDEVTIVALKVEEYAVATYLLALVEAGVDEECRTALFTERPIEVEITARVAL